MPSVIFNDTIASGASTSSGINLTKTWKKVAVRVGTMSTAAAISVQNSDDGGSTFYNVYHQTIQSATVATPQVYIASGVGTGGGVAGIPAEGLVNIRFLATGVVSGGVVLKVICSE